MDTVFPTDYQFPLIIMTVLFLGFMFCPFNTGWRYARWEIILCYLRASISPFDSVKFRTFLIATSTSSVKNMFTDFGDMVCFYQNGNFQSNEPFPPCNWVGGWKHAWSVIPYWWRMW
jgi:hypothetical protein